MTAPGSSTRSRLAPLALLGIVLLGLALRLPWLIRRPLWLDEALQHHISSASDPTGVLARSLAEDLNPPGFSLWVHAMLQLLPGPLALRLPSLLAGLLAIGAAYGAGRAWKDRSTGWAAALLVATCPPWVAWSREGRSYAVALLCLTLLFWAAAACRRHPGALSVAAALAVPWHYGAWPVLVGVLAALGLDPARRRAAGLAAVSAGLVAAPLLAVLGHQAALRGTHPHLAAWYGPDLHAGAPWALGFLLTGSASVWSWPVGVLAGIGLIGAVWRARPPSTLVLAALLPVGIVFAGSVVGLYPVGPIRHVLVLAPGLVLLTAFAMPRLSVGLALGMAALAVVRAPGLPVEDLPAVLPALERAREGEPVWVHPHLGFAARYYGLSEPVLWGRWGEPAPETGWVLVPAHHPAHDPGALEAAGVRAVKLQP